MRKTDIVPADSRYVPLQQQPYLCCPTAIQMVMLRHGIKLLPAELIGHHLGLVVRPEDAHYFYNARTSDNPPDGYGTHIGSEGIDPDAAFKALGIPLTLEIIPADAVETPAEFGDILQQGIAADRDMLLCVRWNDVIEVDSTVEPVDVSAGHIVVVDRVQGERIRIVDPARGSKWKDYDASHLFYAMQAHADKRAAGIWVLKYKETKNV